MKNEIINKFKKIIENPKLDENKIQDYLEKNSELIPLPFLLNHGLHFNLIISKFIISDAYIADFAYLTKSTTFWYFVLTELKSPQKKIFRKKGKDIFFHHDFNNSFDQIHAWKTYIEKNRYSVLEKIKVLRTPISYSPVRFKYVLIIGRNEEIKNYHIKSNFLAEKSSNDIRIFTYDSLISSYKNSSELKKIIITHKKLGYKIKYLNNLNTDIFAYVSPDFLSFSKKQKNLLVNKGYDIDAWEKGELLAFNGKNVFKFSKS